MTPHILGQSKAIYGTWFYLPTYNLMFDCGDGAAFSLGIHSSDIKYIFITHFHADHFLGLFGIANFLNRATRKVKRQIKLYYHEDLKSDLDKVRRSLSELGLDKAFEFISFKFDEKIEIDGKKYVLPFNVDHSAKYYKKKITACGFSICEDRKKLKPEHAEKIEKLSNQEKGEYMKQLSIFNLQSSINIYDIYTYKYITYCGDSLPVDLNKIGQTEILMHECTFLTKKEVDAAHTDLESFIENYKKYISMSEKPFTPTIILYHLTEKYIREQRDYKEIILEKTKELGIKIEVVEINKLFRYYNEI